MQRSPKETQVTPQSSDQAHGQANKLNFAQALQRHNLRAQTSVGRYEDASLMSFLESEHCLHEALIEATCSHQLSDQRLSKAHHAYKALPFLKKSRSAGSNCRTQRRQWKLCDATSDQVSHMNTQVTLNEQCSPSGPARSPGKRLPFSDNPLSLNSQVQPTSPGSMDQNVNKATQKKISSEKILTEQMLSYAEPKARPGQTEASQSEQPMLPTQQRSILHRGMPLFAQMESEEDYKNCYVIEKRLLKKHGSHSPRSQNHRRCIRPQNCLIRKAKKLRERNELYVMSKIRSETLLKNLSGLKIQSAAPMSEVCPNDKNADAAKNEHAQLKKRGNQDKLQSRSDPNGSSMRNLIKDGSGAIKTAMQ